jgi:hypothetical protein
MRTSILVRASAADHHEDELTNVNTRSRTRTRPRSLGTAGVVVSIALCTMSDRAVADPIPYNTDAAGNVTWGSTDPFAWPISDTLPYVGDGLTFYWTSGGIQDPRYQAAVGQNDDVHNPHAVTYHFIPPDDPLVTDWHQTVNYGNGESDVASGAIQRMIFSKGAPAVSTAAPGPWSFFPLDQLPNIGYEIPDFAADGYRIYTAVDLLTYIDTNPLGPVNGNYQIGDTLDGLGLSIVNGRMLGVSGIYFATTPFVFDPNSATGWVPQGGDSAWFNSPTNAAPLAGGQVASGISINGIHKATTPPVPEPTTFSLFLAASLLIALGKSGMLKRVM